MRKILLSTLLTTLAVGLCSNVASAYPNFMKDLKSKYEFKTVSCNTCHSKKEEIAEADLPKYEEDAKHFRNKFGKMFEEPLKGKDIGKRVEEAKAAKKDDNDAKADEIDAGISKDFHEALEKVEAMKDDDGKTYGEKLKAGEIEGTKFPE